MPKVSVIVPVYNVEQYLSQCLDSIRTQTLEDIEIICINDGSTDSSGKILDQYAAMDGRIKVLHKENAGYGAAMNVGIRIAAGEYIGIVESDDRVDSRMYAKLYEAAVSNELDFVKADAYYWFEKLNYLKRIHTDGLNELYNQVLGEEDRNVFFDFYMNIWTGIYKKDFLLGHDIFFHESPGASYQDNGFWMQTCFYAEKAMWLNEAFYYYRQDNPEASVKSTSKILAMTREYDYLEKLLKQRQQEYLLPYCYAMRLVRNKGTFFRIEDTQKYGFVKQIKEDYQQYKAYIKYNRYIDNWMREVIKAPEEYCNRLIAEKARVRNIIWQANGIIIYGAGKQADIAMRILYNEGFYDKIKCFAVSGEPQNPVMASKSILKIEDVFGRYPDAMFMIAVMPGTKAYDEMAERLEKLGVTDYLKMTDVLEHFNYI